MSTPYEDYCRELLSELARRDPATRDVIDAWRNQRGLAWSRIAHCFRTEIARQGVAEEADISIDAFLRRARRV